MAKATQTPKGQLAASNANVQASKQNITDEKGTVIRGLYYLNISTPKGFMQLNVGEKTYKRIKELVGE